MRTFFLLPDYKTCICRGNFLFSREFRRQFSNDLWRGPDWRNVSSWVPSVSSIVLCSVILRKGHVASSRAVFCIVMFPQCRYFNYLSLRDLGWYSLRLTFAKYDTGRIEWRSHLINLHDGTFNFVGRHVFYLFRRKTGGDEENLFLQLYKNVVLT